MSRVRNRVKAIYEKMHGEAGQGLAEYGLVLALIAVVCIGGLSQLGIGIAQSAGFVALPSSF